MTEVPQSRIKRTESVKSSIPIEPENQREDNDLENLLLMRLKLDDSGHITSIRKKAFDGWEDYPELESTHSMWHTVYTPYVQHLLLSLLEQGFLKEALDLEDFAELTDNPWLFVEFNGFHRFMDFSKLKPEALKLQKLVEGKNFIDLGCGGYNESYAGRLIAEFFKARRYVGVDIQNIENNILFVDPFLNENGFKAYYFKNDLSRFVSNINCQSQDGKVFLISGIEGGDQYGTFAAGKVLEDIASKTQIGDVLLIGTTGSSSFNANRNRMEDLGFRQELWLPISECSRNGFEVFVRT